MGQRMATIESGKPAEMAAPGAAMDRMPLVGLE